MDLDVEIAEVVFVRHCANTGYAEKHRKVRVELRPK